MNNNDFKLNGARIVELNNKNEKSTRYIFSLNGYAMSNAKVTENGKTEPAYFLKSPDGTILRFIFQEGGGFKELEDPEDQYAAELYWIDEDLEKFLNLPGVNEVNDFELTQDKNGTLGMIKTVVKPRPEKTYRIEIEANKDEHLYFETVVLSQLLELYELISIHQVLVGGIIIEKKAKNNESIYERITREELDKIEDKEAYLEELKKQDDVVRIYHEHIPLIKSEVLLDLSKLLNNIYGEDHPIKKDRVHTSLSDHIYRRGNEDEYLHFPNYTDTFNNTLEVLKQIFSQIESNDGSLFNRNSPIAKLMQAKLPHVISIMDTKPKNYAFNPNNRTDEKGLVQFTKANGNPINYSRHSIDLIVEPSEILTLESSKKGIAPLNQEDDIVIDVLCSFIIDNASDIDLKDPKNIPLLKQRLFPMVLTEKAVASVITGSQRPTKAQRDKTTKAVMKLTSTAMFMNWEKVAQDYNKNKKFGFTEKEIQDQFKVQDKSNVIEGRVYTKKEHGKPVTKYVIYDTPAFLELALLTGQIKTIPRKLLSVGGVSNEDNFNIIRKHILKVIVDAHKRIEKKEKLENWHKTISIDKLFNDNGVVFTGKTPADQRQKKMRLIKKIGKFLSDLVNEFEYLEECKIVPNIPRKPKEFILFCYKTPPEFLIFL